MSGETTGRQQKKAESRRRILESAREIFFRDGFMAANLDEVAEKAGVAKGTLYRYFESKAELYVAVLAEDGAVLLKGAFADWLDVLQAGLDRNLREPSPTAALRRRSSACGF